MKYEQLRNEDFDDNPRATAAILSEDMREKPLVDQLEYVQKSFNPTDKSKFCCELPRKDWEDAGDWFLSQFADIIKRTQEARQKKRKLAKEFEDEVERRHRHVADRKMQVEHALGEMQRQGQGLIPKSPRPSKSPRKA
jgi:hypothetical protein